LPGEVQARPRQGYGGQATQTEDNTTNTKKAEVNVNMANEEKCPFSAKTHHGRANRDWWPNQLNLNALHTNHPAGNPMGESFDYAEEFKTLDLKAVKKDIEAVMTKSQDWWPADFGHYGLCLSAWRGTVRAPIASTTDAAARGRACCALRPLAVGPTTRILIKLAGCSGRSSRSTAARYRGPT
jgi:hypothetical protein